MRAVSIAFAALVAVPVFAGVGCKPDLIPGTSVEDNEANRKVLEFLGRYQQAMEAKDAEGVVQLCAADYYETNGNTDPLDDYNLDGLRTKLQEHFKRTKEISLEVYVQTVQPDMNDTIAVVYRYNTRALVEFPSAPKWLTATEVNKVRLRAVEGDEAGYRIVSGL